MKDALLWADEEGTVPSRRLQRFLTGTDLDCDRILLPFDLLATQAHVRGLARAGILSAEESDRLVAELDRLSREITAGIRDLDERFEDGHSAIEWWLTEALGELGAKVHTGRSRNDQVLAALRLFERTALERIGCRLVRVAESMLERTRAELRIPMPGYTHLRRAMVTSVGQWWGGYLESVLDDLDLLRATSDWISASPLGTGSGFGVNLPLDRDGVASELSFPRLLLNPHAAQLSRGKFELQVVQICVLILSDLRRLAWDLLLFQSAEFGFVEWPLELSTGSSLMPGKRNPDLLELVRAAPARAIGAWIEVASLQSLPSGYQRDQQAGKKPVIETLLHTEEVLAIARDGLDRLVWNESRLRAALEPGMYRTDLAHELVGKGVAFREAYREAARASDEALADRTPEASLAGRVSPGAAGDPCLERLEERLADHRAAWSM